VLYHRTKHGFGFLFFKYKGIFEWLMTIWKKQILASGIRIPPQKKWGVTVHFSEIIELKFGKKMPYILCLLKLF